MYQPIELTLDTQKMNCIVKTVNQFDNTILHATIRANGDKLQDWVNPTFELIAIKSDDNRVHQKDNITVINVEDQQIDINLNEQIVTYAGRVKLQLIIKDEWRISTTTFSLMVNKSLEGQIIESISNVETLDQLDDYIQKGFELLTEFENRMASTENAMTELDAALTLNENARKQSETTRVNNESQREENERTRATNESNRVRVESDRANAEIQRNENEGARQNAETQRGRNEDERIANEDNRKQAELGREQAYALAEENRNRSYQTQEELRQSNYATNEAIRERNETTRKNAENERVNAETQRGTNETTRQTNESNRVNAINEHTQNLTDLETRADTVIANVEGATEELTGARVDYMGNTHESINQAMDSNVVHAVHQATQSLNHARYEGQTITATNTIAENITALNEAGFQRSAILKGNTLVNVCNYNQHEIDIYRGIKVIDINELSYNLNPSTKYLLSIFIENSNLNVPCDFHNQSTNVHSIFESNMINFQKDGVYTSVVTTKSDLSTVLSVGWFGKGDGLTETTFDAKVLITPYQDGMENWDIPYFTGMSSVKTPVLTTTGKNRYINILPNNDNFEIVDNNNFNVLKGDTNGILVENVKKDSVLSFNMKSSDVVHPTATMFRVYYDDGTVANIQLGDEKILKFSKNVKSVNVVNWCHGTHEISNIQLEDGIDKTTYEVTKSNILSVVEPLELLSNESTLNANTGEVYEPYFKGVLNGTESWRSDPQTDNTFRAYLSLENLTYFTKVKSDVFNGITVGEYTSGVEGIVCNSANTIALAIKKEKLNELSLNGFKEYLTNNNVTFVSKMTTPSLKTVKLSGDVVSYDGQTHYTCESEAGSLVPTLSIDVPTDVNALISEQRATIERQKGEISELQVVNEGLVADQVIQTENIVLNSDAINFMLFPPVLSAVKSISKGEKSMAAYFANQIKLGRLEYTMVVARYPEFKEDIDLILFTDGFGHLIVE